MSPQSMPDSAPIDRDTLYEIAVGEYATHNLDRPYELRQKRCRFPLLTERSSDYDLVARQIWPRKAPLKIDPTLRPILNAQQCLAGFFKSPLETKCTLSSAFRGVFLNQKPILH